MWKLDHKGGWKFKECLVTQSCPTLCDPMDCSLPGSSVHGIFQARILEWVAISFSRGSSRPRDRTRVSHVAGRHFTVWATREVKGCWAPKNWCFWTVVLEKTLESSLDSKEFKLINPKGSQPWIFIGRTDAEVWSWSSKTLATWCEVLTHWKRPWCGKDRGQEEKRSTEDEMLGWHHWLNGLEFEQAPGDSEGQGSLACCS